ncbi:MAG TPA: hypothetical protein P5121_37030 [Caldilineaceae bacterium]|nr:hypothetical protein [Caldilineaceae bacterium]
MTKSHPLLGIGYMVLWLLLVALATLTAWQLHVTTLYWGTLLINSPTWRPSGWSSESLVGVSKLSILFWGALWLILTFYLEYHLRAAMQRKRLLRQSGWWGGILLTIYAIAYLVIR